MSRFRPHFNKKPVLICFIPYGLLYDSVDAGQTIIDSLMTPSFPSLQVIHSIVTSSCLRSDHDVLRDSTAMYTRKVHGRLENIPFPISASFWIVNPQNTFTNNVLGSTHFGFWWPICHYQLPRCVQEQGPVPVQG